jgi:hypothetical protein
METLGIVALALGAASLLRTAAAFAAYRAWLRRGRIRDFEPGPTPPISVVVDGPPEPFLRQNYPEYEVVAGAPPREDTDVEVRVGGEPRFEFTLFANPALRPDPLFLRDAAAAADVTFVPALTAARTVDERLRALFQNSDGILLGVLGGPRCVRGAARTRNAGAIARRPVRMEARGFRWGDARSPVAAALAAAPALLAVSVPWRPGALTLLILIALARVATAVSVELRFVRDGSTLAALPWLPVAFLAEPLLLLFGRGRSATLGSR